MYTIEKFYAVLNQIYDQNEEDLLIEGILPENHLDLPRYAQLSIDNIIVEKWKGLQQQQICVFNLKASEDLELFIPNREIHGENTRHLWISAMNDDVKDKDQIEKMYSFSVKSCLEIIENIAKESPFPRDLEVNVLYLGTDREEHPITGYTYNVCLSLKGLHLACIFNHAPDCFCRLGK